MGGTDLSGSADDDFHGNLWLIEHPLGVIGGANKQRAGRGRNPYLDEKLAKPIAFVEEGAVAKGR